MQESDFHATSSERQKSYRQARSPPVSSQKVTTPALTNPGVNTLAGSDGLEIDTGGERTWSGSLSRIARMSESEESGELVVTPLEDLPVPGRTSWASLASSGVPALKRRFFSVRPSSSVTGPSLTVTSDTARVSAVTLHLTVSAAAVYSRVRWCTRCTQGRVVYRVVGRTTLPSVLSYPWKRTTLPRVLYPAQGRLPCPKSYLSSSGKTRK